MNKSKIVIYSLLLLTLTSCDYVLYIRWMQIMKNYKWYAGSLVFPISGCLFFWVPVWIKKYILKKDFSIENKFSQKKLFVLGSLDSVSSILTSYATPYLSVLMMTLLDKLSLPLTMLISYFYLGTSYLINHYLGTFLTMYGLLVAFIPQMLLGNQKLNYYWLVIYISSLIPSVLSYCYKEKSLKDVDLDIWWMNAWISVWQVIFGILTIPIIFAPLPSGEDLQLNQVSEYFYNATLCQFSNDDNKNGDSCQNAIYILMMYQLISTLTNILMFYIIKEESSAVYLVINTVKMPVTAWLGSYQVLVGNQAEKVNVADFFSFVMIIVGIIVYNYHEEKDERKKSIDNDELHFQLTDG